MKWEKVEVESIIHFPWGKISGSQKEGGNLGPNSQRKGSPTLEDSFLKCSKNYLKSEMKLIFYFWKSGIEDNWRGTSESMYEYSLGAVAGDGVKQKNVGFVAQAKQARRFRLFVNKISGNINFSHFFQMGGSRGSPLWLCHSLGGWVTNHPPSC